MNMGSIDSILEVSALLILIKYHNMFIDCTANNTFLYFQPCEKYKHLWEILLCRDYIQTDGLGILGAHSHLSPPIIIFWLRLQNDPFLANGKQSLIIICGSLAFGVSLR
jgi:hypothetical protein